MTCWKDENKPKKRPGLAHLKKRCSNDKPKRMNSNPAEGYSFLSKILFEKSVNKPKESGIDPYFHRERPIFKQERKCWNFKAFKAFYAINNVMKCLKPKTLLNTRNLQTVWPDLAKNWKRFGNFMTAFCFGQNFKPNLANNACYRAKFHCCKWPKLKHNLAIWSHCLLTRKKQYSVVLRLNIVFSIHVKWNGADFKIACCDQFQKHSRVCGLLLNKSPFKFWPFWH